MRWISKGRRLVLLQWDALSLLITILIVILLKQLTVVLQRWQLESNAFCPSKLCLPTRGMVIWHPLVWQRLCTLPVGVSVAYQLTTGVGGNKVTTANEAGFGLYYTGRPDLALGIELDWRWSTLETQQISRSTLAWVNFRYYWN